MPNLTFCVGDIMLMEASINHEDNEGGGGDPNGHISYLFRSKMVHKCLRGSKNFHKTFRMVYGWSPYVKLTCLEVIFIEPGEFAKMFTSLL